MDNNQQLMVTWLEEEMLDVAKQDVYFACKAASGLRTTKGSPIFWEPSGD